MVDAPEQQFATKPKVPRPIRHQFSIANLLGLLALVALSLGFAITTIRLREAERELTRLRNEVGYLEPTEAGQIAAVRLASEEPMTYRLRVRIPTGSKYRLVYSSMWPRGATAPSWFGAVPISPGESTLLVRVMKDPRDDRWKIAALGQSTDQRRRIATVLPTEQIEVFRGSHDWLASGIPQTTTIRSSGQTIRLLDERVLVGEGAMMLYGDRPPDEDMIGVFAELQPDVGPI